MPNVDAADLATELTHAGEYGNGSIKHKKVTPTEVPAQGDVYRFGKVPQNSLVYDFREVHEALGGTGVTLSFGYRAVDGSDDNDAAFLAAGDVVTAGNQRTPKAPVLVAKESFLVAVVGGGAPVNAAAVEVVAQYVYRGTK